MAAKLLWLAASTVALPALAVSLTKDEVSAPLAVASGRSARKLGIVAATAVAEKTPVEKVDTPLWILFASRAQKSGGEAEGPPQWVLGVAICIAGTCLTSLGLVLQKHSHSENAKSGGGAVVYYRQPCWLLGFTFFLAGQIVNVVAMAFAPQAMLSCLGAWSLIFNAIFARSILGEDLYLLDLLGMTGIVIGALIVIHTTPASAHAVDKGLAGETAGLQEIAGPLFRAFFLLLSAGIALLLVLFHLVVEYRFPDLTPLFWTLCSAIASGYSVTLFKCISFLIIASEHVHPLEHWQCYVVVVVACLLCVAQLHMVNLALHSGRAMSVVPTLFALNMLAQIGICEAAYREMQGITGFEAAGFVSGIVLILVCVNAIVRMKIAMESEPSEDYIEDEPESNRSMESSEPEKRDKRSMSLPARTWSMDDFLDPLPAGRGRTCSLDSDAFTESFVGRSRSYTISVTGPMGLA